MRDFLSLIRGLDPSLCGVREDKDAIYEKVVHLLHYGTDEFRRNLFTEMGSYGKTVLRNALQTVPKTALRNLLSIKVPEVFEEFWENSAISVLDIPCETEESVKEMLLLYLYHIQFAQFEKKDFSKLFHLSKHGNGSIRYLSLLCIAKLFNMTEEETERLSKEEGDYGMEIQAWLGEQMYETYQAETDFSKYIPEGKAVEKIKIPETQRNMVFTQTTKEVLRHIVLNILTKKPLVVTGEAGCGKTFFLHQVSEWFSNEEPISLFFDHQTDAKSLIGMYTSGENAGEFVWKAGVLTKALEEGKWVVFEDIDKCPDEILTSIYSIIENRELVLNDRHVTIKAHPNFQLLATMRTNPLKHCEMAKEGEEEEESAMEIEESCQSAVSPCFQFPESVPALVSRWNRIQIPSPSKAELGEIVCVMYPSLKDVIPKVLETYETVTTRLNEDKSQASRHIGIRDLLGFAKRISNLTFTPQFTEQSRYQLVKYATMSFLSHLSHLKPGFIGLLGDIWEVSREMSLSIGKEKPCVLRCGKMLQVGNERVCGEEEEETPRKKRKQENTYAYTSVHSRVLEELVVATKCEEACLLVGDTGTGKTAVIQQYAELCGKKFVVYNFNDQSEASELLGGFHPVDSFQAKVESCARGGLEKLKKHVGSKDKLLGDWETVATLVFEAKQKKGSLRFEFREGILVEAMRKGYWMILDEINLAPNDLLQRIQGLVAGRKLVLAECEEGIVAHEDFRIFACMNPPTIAPMQSNENIVASSAVNVSSIAAGKRQLPPGIRSRFTEIFVEEVDTNDDLLLVVAKYLEVMPDPPLVGIVAFYQECRKLAENGELLDGGSKIVHFSLRNLTRALCFAVNLMQRVEPVLGLIEGMLMSFSTCLDPTSATLVKLLCYKCFARKLPVVKEKKEPVAEVEIERKALGDVFLSKEEIAVKKELICPMWKGKVSIEGHWIEQGRLVIKVKEAHRHFMVTPSVRVNLQNICRVLSGGRYPVLLEGPTSAGKTTLVKFIAEVTGHNIVRINNHEHTDLQEYLGQYVCDPATGNLVFQEGPLVTAARRGDWVILDELNLAPSEILEALNRNLFPVENCPQGRLEMAAFLVSPGRS